jgi:hypothetical protein
MSTPTAYFDISVSNAALLSILPDNFNVLIKIIGLISKGKKAMKIITDKNPILRAKRFFLLVPTWLLPLILGFGLRRFRRMSFVTVTFR